MSVETLEMGTAMPRTGSRLIVAHRAAATNNIAPRVGRFLAISAVAGAVGAAAAYLSTIAVVPVWAMFMGWVAYFTRGRSGRDGLVNYVCLALGLLVGFGAAAALGALGSVLTVYTLPIVVFGVGLIVVSLRALPTFSNVPSYFLGVISVFAAHVTPTLQAFAELGGASAIGSIAAWLASTVQARVADRV